MLVAFLLLVYIYDADATNTHISMLAVIVEGQLEKMPTSNFLIVTYRQKRKKIVKRIATK
jgi:hypothetical protein